MLVARDNGLLVDPALPPKTDLDGVLVTDRAQTAARAAVPNPSALARIARPHTRAAGQSGARARSEVEDLLAHLPATSTIERRNSSVIVDGLELHHRALEMAARTKLSVDDLYRAATDPEDTWRSQADNATVCLRGKVAVLVADDNDEVFAISSRESALKIRQQPRDGAVKKATGRGASKPFPQDVATLLRQAKARGFQVQRDANHYILIDPRTGQQTTVPKTPSDHRSIPNTVMQIRRLTGIDIRETPIADDTGAA